MTLRLKYGFDGTSANSYKQRWKHENGNDKYIFCSSLVPLELVREDDNDVLLKNPVPSSTRFCRPIRLQFIKEDEEVIKVEDQKIKQEIANLKNLNVSGFNVKYDLTLTMIDGKVK